jgi:ubiquinone biosynthesis protein Coq4
MKKTLLKLRSQILVYLTHRVALPVLKLLRRAPKWNINMEELKMLPSGSLGNDLFHFLNERQLKLLVYYARHDLKHILLGYDTTDAGEACLQCFMLGNGRISFPVVATVLYSCFTMPEYWNEMRSAFRRGRKTIPLHALPWQELLPENTMMLRKKLFYKH